MELSLVLVGGSDSHIDAILSSTDQNGTSTPCLFLGNASAAQNFDLLQSLGVTHILTAAFGNPDPKDNVGAVFPEHFAYHEVRISDGREVDLNPYLELSADFIRDALLHPQHRVFVHCMMGTSRSVSLLLYYMMRDRHYTLRNALLHIMHQRSTNPNAPYTRPNTGFMRQLIDCEKILRKSDTSSVSLSKYMREMSSGQNISQGPVPEPNPRHPKTKTQNQN
jgi:protein-tyrosine phosphatase